MPLVAEDGIGRKRIKEALSTQKIEPRKSGFYLCNMVRMEKTAPSEGSEREPPIEDRMNKVNLGDSEKPRPVLISSSLSGEERDAYIELLNEFKDVFA